MALTEPEFNVGLELPCKLGFPVLFSVLTLNVTEQHLKTLKIVMDHGALIDDTMNDLTAWQWVYLNDPLVSSAFVDSTRYMLSRNPRFILQMPAKALFMEPSFRDMLRDAMSRGIKLSEYIEHQSSPLCEIHHGWIEDRTSDVLFPCSLSNLEFLISIRGILHITNKSGNLDTQKKARFRGVMVSTSDFESDNLSSTLGGTCLFKTLSIVFADLW